MDLPVRKKTVCLGMPGYGELTAGAARGFWMASHGQLVAGGSQIDLEVNRLYSEGSLLAQNFNCLWCWPLNLELEGAHVDYFAMQHADIEPEDWWLDKLIRELEDRELDVLGVAVPIKDALGLSSIALAKPDGDPWRVLCRLTMHEIYNLPETFTSDDVGHPLLLNTGLWVCRFDSEWAKQVRFTVNDRIAFSQARNLYVAQVEPEDWYFSRLCHELGLKIGVTRKVAVEHSGKLCFTNTEPWGRHKFDASHVEASVLPSPDVGDFRFPHDVEGWLTYEEGQALSELATGKRVLEIGSFCGRSTICLAQSADRVVAVDPHDGRATPSPQPTRQNLENNLDRYGVLGQVDIAEKTFQDYAETIHTITELSGLPFTPFDLIFIDGAHDYDSVKQDIELALPLLAEQGVLAFHDYRSTPGEFDGRWDPGVTQAINELIAEGGQLLSQHGTLAVIEPAGVLSSV